MRKWKSRLGVLSLLIVVVAILYYRAIPPVKPPETPPASAPANVASGVDTEDRPTGGSSDDGLSSARHDPSAEPARDTPASTVSTSTTPANVLDEQVRMGSWLDNYQASIRNSDPGDFELMQQRAEEQDPEAAFWLHEFYKFCDDVPRSDWQFDYALARTERRVDHAVDHTGDARGLWRVQNALDWYEQGYKLCSFLGPDFDTKAASLAWLETSADLGHMPALRLYHSQARQLLTDDDSTLGFQQPDLIRQFKSNAKRYARELLATGHPQGYLLMARMYYVGDVYEQDFLNAYAYARAGYLVGTAGGQADAQMWMRLIGTKLPPAEIANADKLANEILGSN